MTRGNRRFQGRAPLAGDDWLKANMPPLISFANAHAGVIFITWDEGSGTNKMPFLAVGPGVGSKDSPARPREPASASGFAAALVDIDQVYAGCDD